MTIRPDDPDAVAVVAAIRTGDVPMLKRLLAENQGLATAQIGDSLCSRSLLHVATDWPGHYPNVATTVAVLTAADADPDARFMGRHSETPLHWAASSDDVEALDALLDAGAQIDAAGGAMGGGPPLEDARIFGQWRAAHRLVARGAVTRLDDEAALGLMDRLVARFAKSSTLPQQPDIDQALWYACHGGQQPAVDYLLGQGADLNWIPSWDRLTPLDAAERSNAENCTHADGLISWLRSKGARSATVG